ncbi:unnamed protein product [Camellia sinensis]
MASSNRHWPSMFKSKPCNTHHHHQWQHDINPSLISSGCHRAPFTSVPGSEERTPEPKPRWNPKPEQIRILEAIFNSGMVNPPRDEIRKIRAQLQEYGQVGDANVFYWFQNRKSRSKHKNRHLQNPKQPSTATAPSSSSSSSEKSSPKIADKAGFPVSPTASVNQTYFQSTPPPPGEFLPEPLFFPAAAASVFTQGFCFPEMGHGVVHHVPVDQTVGNCSGFLLSELMMNHGGGGGGGYGKKVEDEKMNYSVATTTTAPITSIPHCIVSHTGTSVTVPSTISHTLGPGVGESCSATQTRSTVFINDVAFEVGVGPFNVREAFGGDAVLIHSSGQPVLTNEWGVTLHSLQHGGFYYVSYNSQHASTA